MLGNIMVIVIAIIGVFVMRKIRPEISMVYAAYVSIVVSLMFLAQHALAL